MYAAARTLSLVNSCDFSEDAAHKMLLLNAARETDSDAACPTVAAELAMPPGVAAYARPAIGSFQRPAVSADIIKKFRVALFRSTRAASSESTSVQREAAQEAIKRS
jgi:hypothetical protein